MMGRSDRIEVRCGPCGTTLQAPLALAGKRAKCRVCGNKMTVPSPPAPVEELLPLDDDEPLLFEPSRPKRKPSREVEDEDDDRPRRKRPSQSRPIWPWVVGGGVLFVVLAITLYFTFRSKTSGLEGGASGGTPASVYGKWHASTPDVEYEYEFQEGGFGLVSGSGFNQYSVRRFNCEVKASGGAMTLALDSGSCAVSFESDGRLTIQKSFRLTRDGLELADAPITLLRGPMKDRDR